MEWMTWEDAIAFWGERLQHSPDDISMGALVRDGIRYLRGEARMAHLEPSRWADDGGKV